MAKKVNHVLVGKDISATLNLTLGSATASSTLAEGELVVLDKNMKILAPGSTKEDSDTIYIGIGLSTTYYNPGQTTYTKRSMKVSPAITNPTLWVGQSYAAPAKQVWTLGLPSIALNKEYQLNIIYTDNHMTNQTPAMVQDKYTITTVGTYSTYLKEWVVAVNNDSNCRVTAAVTGATTMTLTAKDIPGQTLTNYDMNYVVEFQPFFYDISTSDVKSINSKTRIANTTALSYGSGSWQEVRDLERSCKEYEGYADAQAFPRWDHESAYLTVKDETYDLLTIEWSLPFVSAEAQNVKTADQALIIAVPNPTTSNQQTELLAALNPWMESWGLTAVTI